VLCVSWVALLVVAVLALRASRRRTRRYRLAAPLGAGGMGSVFRAEVGSGAPVAVKVLERPDAASEAAFWAEVERTAAIRHPGVVRVLDWGRLPDGRPFYAMPLVEGYDLRRLLDVWGRQDPSRVARVVASLCDAVGAIHTKGWVHRDLKPANVMLSLGDDGDVVTVIDLGLVKGPGDALADSDALVGTPRYLAPEVVRAPGRATPASDAFALGVLAFELRWGRPPFGDDPTARPSVGRPDAAADVDANAALAAFDAAIVSCLDPDPERRPTLRALRDAAHAALGARPWTSTDARSWWDGHRP
jgi:serine/threonine protein kinase